MVNLTSLKEYFGILLEKENSYSSEHAFAEDERRFSLFKRIRDDFHTMSRKMAEVAGLLKSTYPEYKDLAQSLQKNFDTLSGISNEDFDYYLRTLAVEKMIFNKEATGQAVPDMLEHLMQGMMQLFVGGDGQKMGALIHDTLATLKVQQKKRRFFEAKSAKLLRDELEAAAQTYEQIEHDLLLAKEGIIAKDKRMLELLQKLQIGLGDSLVKAAVEHSPLRMPEKNVLSFSETIRRTAMRGKAQKSAMTADGKRTTPTRRGGGGNRVA